MRNLYLAIRASRKALLNASKSARFNPEQMAFLRCLLAYERYNRGHQHTLDTWSDPKCCDDGNRLRRQNARSHLEALLATFSQLAQADWPDMEGMPAILDAACPNGVLGTLTLLHLQRFATFDCKRPDDIRLTPTASLFQGGELRMTINLASQDGRLKATRQLMLPMAEPTTLRAARLALRDAKRALRGMLADMSAWPEFCASRRDAMALDVATQGLRRFLQGLPADARQQLTLNWAQLRPS